MPVHELALQPGQIVAGELGALSLRYARSAGQDAASAIVVRQSAGFDDLRDSRAAGAAHRSWSAADRDCIAVSLQQGQTAMEACGFSGNLERSPHGGWDGDVLACPVFVIERGRLRGAFICGTRNMVEALVEIGRYILDVSRLPSLVRIALP